jgi:5,10-methylenetetrahydromethanopterin reductase
MDLGVVIAEGTEGWKTAVRAEQLGYSGVWFEDSQMVAADPVAMMTLAAVNTTKVKIGSGVLIPSNRIAPQAANSFATLNNLAPGRIAMGVGTGFSGRRAMGHPPMTRRALKTYVETFNALMRRETVEWEFEGRTRKIAFVHPDKNLVNTTDPVDVYVAAQGPLMRELTAEVDAHWMALYTQPDIAGSDMADMRRARSALGKDPDAFESVILMGGTPLDPGEPADSPKAMARGGPMAACYMHSIVETEALALGEGLNPPEGLDDNPYIAGYRELYEGYEPADARYLSLHRGHAVFLRDDERHLITGDLIRQTTMTAEVGELRERFQELKRHGYDQAIFLVHPGQEEVLQDWVKVMEGV